MTRQKDNFELLVEEETLIEETMEMISEILEKEDISRTEFAGLLGKSKSHVSQLLSGERNMTLRTLAQVMYALQYRAKIAVEPLSEENCAVSGIRKWNDERSNVAYDANASVRGVLELCQMAGKDFERTFFGPVLTADKKVRRIHNYSGDFRNRRLTKAVQVPDEVAFQKVSA